METVAVAAEYFTTEQTAQILGLTVITLCLWRTQGKHLAFHKFGKVIRYSRTEIDRFTQSTLQHNTIYNP
jgi:hypothetical protein